MSIHLGAEEQCKVYLGGEEQCIAYLGQESFFGCEAPPTVEDVTRIYSGGSYQFTLSDFTKNFKDPNGDSYQKTRIETLPSIGTIYDNGVPVNAGAEFELSRVGDLTYSFPNNYVITDKGYCVYERPVSEIISEKEAEGFTLVTRTAGSLTFEKEELDSAPNTTDIYAFFDATSMKIEDAEAAASALNSWFTSYKNTNTLYTGNLYILPVMMENWLGFPKAILRGSLAAVGNNSSRPADDYMAFAQIPANFDIDTDNENLNWTAPTNVLTLAFIDEVADGTSLYHKNRNGYGFDGQPSTQYLTDYKDFVDNYSRFNFFKGIFYPIPDIDYGNFNNIYNACVLQGFAAIEGGATYTLSEIEALEVTYAKERRFHWHLDPSHPYYTGSGPIANPYSSEAQTAVPNTTYNLQGLKNFGWRGVYDKDQPASNVFTSTSFNSELSSYLQGETTSTIIQEEVNGVCYAQPTICFTFKTSDNSTSILYSNTAKMCLALSTNNTAPTVQSNTVPMRIVETTFSSLHFTKGFTDTEGHSYNNVEITALPIVGELRYLGQPIVTKHKLKANNATSLSFVLPDSYAVYGGILYSFPKSIDAIVLEQKALGRDLTNNSNGVLTFTSAADEIKITGAQVDRSVLTFKFRISDDAINELQSNEASISMLPEGNINIKTTYTNKPPVVGDNLLKTGYNKTLVFAQADFIDNTDPRFFDEEGNLPYELKVLSLPLNGTLYLRGVAVVKNQILSFTDDIQTGDFTYVPDSSRTDIPYVEFEFAVSDTGSKIFAQ